MKNKEIRYYRIPEEIINKCEYKGCRRIARVLLRKGNSQYFIPLCKKCEKRWNMIDDPRIKERFDRLKKERRRILG